MRFFEMSREKPTGEGWNPTLYNVPIDMGLVALWDDDYKSKAKAITDMLVPYVQSMLDMCKENNYPTDGMLYITAHLEKK